MMSAAVSVEFATLASVEFAMLAVMPSGLVPLPLDMVLLEFGAPGVRRTLDQKKWNEAGDISNSGVLCFFPFTVWLQTAFRCQREAVVCAERGTVKKLFVSEKVRGLGVFTEPIMPQLLRLHHPPPPSTEPQGRDTPVGSQPTTACHTAIV